MTASVVGDELKSTPSPEHLWNQSDVVATVRIIEGKIVGERYQMIGEVGHLLKGKVKSDRLIFEHGVNYYSDLPASLGKNYLIFLKGKTGNFATIDLPFSVIEFGKFYLNRDDVDLVFNKLGLKKTSGVSMDDNFFLYPERCIHSSEFICSKSVNILKYVIETGAGAKEVVHGKGSSHCVCHMRATR